jgi:hypothetical protein
MVGRRSEKCEQYFGGETSFKDVTWKNEKEMGL